MNGKAPANCFARTHPLLLLIGLVPGIGAVRVRRLIPVHRVGRGIRVPLVRPLLVVAIAIVSHGIARYVRINRPCVGRIREQQ